MGRGDLARPSMFSLSPTTASLSHTPSLIRSLSLLPVWCASGTTPSCTPTQRRGGEGSVVRAHPHHTTRPAPVCLTRSTSLSLATPRATVPDVTLVLAEGDLFGAGEGRSLPPMDSTIVQERQSDSSHKQGQSTPCLRSVTGQPLKKIRARRTI